jgi:thiol-disulfide isomerase/thioredoxin
MKYNKLTTSLFFSGMLLLSGCGSSSNSSSSSTEAQPAATTAATSNALASTTIVTTSGKAIQVDKTAGGFIFHGYEGKIILLEVYGDTCPHCVAAIPAYNRLQAKYPNDVKIIALESYGTLGNASQQLYDTVAKANTGNMFPLIKEQTGYGLQAVPYLMILNKNGNIIYNEVLVDFPEAAIDNLIQELR